MASNKMFRNSLVPRSKWFITRGVNEPIVTEEEFKEAQSVIRTPVKKNGFNVHDFALRGKIRCGHCQCLMSYNLIPYEPKIWCSSGHESSHSNCSGDVYSLGRIEGIVFYELRRYLETVESLGIWMKEREKEVRRAERQAAKQKQMDKEAIETLSAEKMRVYENYSSGLVTLEEFQKEKARLDGKIKELKAGIARAEDEAAQQKDSLDSRMKETVEQASVFKGVEKLTKEMAEAFIDTVYLHDGGEVEIVFKSGDQIMEMAGKVLENGQ